jgi:hypothetical protein
VKLGHLPHDSSIVVIAATKQHRETTTEKKGSSDAIRTIISANMTLVQTFSHARPPGLSSLLPLLVSLLLLSPWLRPVEAMSRQRQLDLREEAREMFRHGWENYWDIAFPEDEVGVAGRVGSCND